MTSGAPVPKLPQPHAGGVWTLAGDRLIIADAEGAATILVPTERVRMLAVDLPLPNRARRLAALPFAVEDHVAEPLETLHLALGASVAGSGHPHRYLAGIVQQSVMAQWVALAEAQGLHGAAMVPDALLLPRPVEGWTVSVREGRALVLAADGTGFAVPAAVLRAAWEAAGRPPVQNQGEPLPEEMQAVPVAPDSVSAAARAAMAADLLDLRQGAFAPPRATIGKNWNRFGWIVGIGVAAHVLIAGADLVALRVIADRRAQEVRTLAATAAPRADLSGDPRAKIADLLPASGGGTPDRFLPLLARVSAALGPLGSGIAVRTLGYEGSVLTLDLAPGEPGLAGKIDAALRAARVRGRAVAAPDGAIRVTASAV